MMKNIYVVANWKSNMTMAQGLDWISKVGPNIPKTEELKVIVCPALSSVSEILKTIKVGGFPIMVGSQDISPFGVGAYTGEESASLVKDLVEFSIIGHSERRQNFFESDEMVSRKVNQASEQGITPIFCVQGSDTPVPEICTLVAYEPVFAIGTGNPDTPESADKVAKMLKDLYKSEMEVLYGGSVTAENVKSFIVEENINGVLVGKASLNADEFIAIIKECMSEAN